MDPRIELALEIMLRGLDEPQLVNRISARLGLSPSRFEHLFKAATGQTFKARLRAARMDKAKELLLDPTQSIKEVAAAVGYKHARNFTRDFAMRHGKPPSQHRISSLVAGFAS